MNKRAGDKTSPARLFVLFNFTFTKVLSLQRHGHTKTTRYPTNTIQNSNYYIVHPLPLTTN